MEDKTVSLLEVVNIKKDYGSRLGGSVCHALRGISFEVNEGEFLGIMGPSGAGKTTLLNIIATIDNPTYGNVFLKGEDVTLLKEPKLSFFRREKLGFIFQDSNLLDTLTVRENIILPLALLKMGAADIQKRMDDIARELNLVDILDKYPYEISGGQKQKTAAARAVVKKPSLILADEPAGSLDSKSARDLLENIQNLNKVFNSTIILITHDAYIASYCRRIIFIKDGLFFSEIVSSKGRKEFFDKIINMLSVLEGGGASELI
jgi:putative ABC transport system ATP-binding protein